ncbi:peptidase M23 [Micromonospora sp. DT233]|uniref:peptidase M23 n=1 Tax=Micromonospora sp. DT233 TaxID=3393432 RepID=UPI003CEAB84F
MRQLRPWTGVSVALLAAGLLISAQPAVASAAPKPVLPSVTDAVTSKLLGQVERSGMSATATGETRIKVDRQDGQWAFGTAVAVAPRIKDAHPTGAVFIARADAGRWQVAFDGEAAFSTLAASSPLVTAQERQVFKASPALGTLAGNDMRTGMALPFAVGQTWTLTGGPHGWGGGPPYSSIDLSGGDHVVRAARGGTAYTMCQGWIRVIHDRGYSTDYYHLWNSISVNGAGVGEGAYLGNTGTDVTCGGSATGRHVHFGLRQNSAYVAITGHGIGKWEIVAGAAYQGGARHGSAWAPVGYGVYNYGALGFNQAVVDANGGGTLTRRSGPGSGYGAVGSVGDGGTVTISCSANGTTHTGRYGATALWNRLTDGSWVSDAYLWTGVNGPINGWC